MNAELNTEELQVSSLIDLNSLHENKSHIVREVTEQVHAQINLQPEPPLQQIDLQPELIIDSPPLNPQLPPENPKQPHKWTKDEEEIFKKAILACDPQERRKFKNIHKNNLELQHISRVQLQSKFATKSFQQWFTTNQLPKTPVTKWTLHEEEAFKNALLRTAPNDRQKFKTVRQNCQELQHLTNNQLRDKFRTKGFQTWYREQNHCQPQMVEQFGQPPLPLLPHPEDLITVKPEELLPKPETQQL